MPRKYDRKTSRAKVPHDHIKKGIEDVLTYGKSIRSVANELGLPATTFCRYIKQAKKDVKSVHIGYEGNKPTIFSTDQEATLVQYLKTAANIYFGLPPKEVRILAYECANAFNVKMPDSWIENKSAGYDWFTSFMKRHSLSIRTPEPTSLSRATSFNRTNVRAFFQKLAEARTKHNIQSFDIWNVDETGMTTVQKSRNVVAPKGMKQIGSLTSAERGSLVTLCLAVSASGNTIPPMMIFPRVKYYDHFVRDGPSGCIGGAHPSGWMTSDNFLQFIKHFANHVKPTQEKKVLLLLDNHISHISIDTLNFAKENGIVILSFPPHCSHKLQPLDRTVFGPFKRYFASAQDKWMRSYPGKTLSIYDLPALAKESLLKATTPQNIMSGFEVSGIHPFNPDVFSDMDFGPSTVTDRPEPPSVVEMAEPSPVVEMAEASPVVEMSGDSPVVEMAMINESSNTSEITPNHASHSRNNDTDELNSYIVQGMNTDESPASLERENAWEEINNHVKVYGREVIKVRGNGHCLLYAVSESLASEGIVTISHEALGILLKNEIEENLDFYEDFTQNVDLVHDVEQYVENMDYNNDSGDILLSAICNMLGVSAIIYTFRQHELGFLAQTPERPGVAVKGEIHLALYGNGADAHYNWLRRRETNQTEQIQTNSVDTTFSPEVVRPHPKAPPRKSNGSNKRRRRTAILTDTPEKQAIEFEHKERMKKQHKKQTQQNQAGKGKKPSKVTKRKTKLTVLTASDDEDDCYCLVCVEPYSNSRSREKWIKCNGCNGWAHLDCTDVTGNGLYICQNCDSDDDIGL